VTSNSSRTGAVAPGERTLDPRRRTPLRPVVVWSGIGVLFLGLILWVLGRWILDGGSHRVDPHGEMSTARTAALWAWQTANALAFAVFAWHYIAESRRAGRVSDNAALFFGFFTTFWISPVLNYREQPLVLFNPHTVSVSSWGPYIPGWHGTQPSRQVETLLAAGGIACALTFCWILATWAVVHRLVRDRPSWGIGQVTTATVVIALVVEVILETPFVLVGGYSWTSSSLSLYGGHWYQLPLYAIVLTPVILVAPTVLLLHYATRTHTDVWPLRGSDRPTVRLLAGAGWANLNILIWLILLHLASLILSAPAPADTPVWLRL
jgi:hypothetical protein